MPLKAFIFDLDGVLTGTAHLHQRAWKRLFDGFLASRDDWPPDAETRPFTPDDYHRFVDGKPRLDGVRSFLASRGIEMVDRGADAEPGAESVESLGRRKDRYFRELVSAEGVQRFDGSIRFVERLREEGLPVAVVTSSRNGRRILAEAGIDHLFDVRIDGEDAAEAGLPGKPDPATFLEAARRLGVPAAEAAVVEDAAGGVEAGRRGGFGWVVGVAREVAPEALEAAGADVVVSDLSELECPPS